MKIKKSAVSILLVMSLIISSLVPSMVFADAPDNSASIIRLQQLGVVDSSLINVNSLLTRAQLAKAIAVAKDLTDEAATLSGSTIFPDVESYSELSGYVNALLSRGLMYGRPDGYFHPEGGVSYSEACIILVKLLGYTDSDVTGMWPNNYISKATDLKLNKNITLKKNDNITVGAAAVMLDRLLDTNMKKANAAEADKTFSESIGLYTDVIIYDNSDTSNSVASNEILTNSGTLYLSSLKADFQVGGTYRVEVKDKNIVKVYGKVKETFNATIKSYIDNIISYDDNGDLKNRTLPSGTIYYYHGIKQEYSNIGSLMKTNTTIVFGYNVDNTGFDYAVIKDPIYSKPQIALNFDPNSNKLGDITFESTMSIIKNGHSIAKNEIENFDVVYSVTDTNGNNKYIQVFDNRIEGKITSFEANGSIPTGIKLDEKVYIYGKDMDLSKISKFNSYDEVSVLLGYDGKTVVDMEKIDYKLKDLKEVRILENSTSSSKILTTQVVTDQGTYYLRDNLDNLEVGGQYKVYIDGDTIVKIKEKESSQDNYSVLEVEGSSIKYNNGTGDEELSLPQISTYYYNGSKTDYNTALRALQPCSSIVLAKVDGKYEYGIVIDPVYSAPIVNDDKDANSQAIVNLNNSKHLYVYKEDQLVQSIDGLQHGDAIYKVSDLWNINRYIVISNKKVVGQVLEVTPNKLAPRSIQIDDKIYNLSKYFDVSKLNKYNVSAGSYNTISLDVDGNIIDIN
jgi:hypothetical protein